MACMNMVEFPRRYSPGVIGGPMFSTVVVVGQTGKEQRIRQWIQGRWKFDVSQLLRKRNQAEELTAFFLVNGGSECGFLFYDWFDHSSLIAGVETQHATAMLTTTTFQLQKVYSLGGLTYARKIKTPIADSVHVFNSGAEVFTGWTVDLETGILTFDSAPGYVPDATFGFFVPVRFSSDEMQMQMQNPGRLDWSKIALVEIR